MQRTTRPEGLDLPSPHLQRNGSLSSDRTPPVTGTSLLSPPSVSPEPAYIAAAAASQMVNSDRAEHGQDSYNPRGTHAELDTTVVSTGSLSLVNAFLDQLLFSFLASSRSTSIASLRPAILEVLKPRLGKEAIDGADEELQGYLAGGDAEELFAFHSGQEFKGEYNLNLIWRRTRLRCMVYTRLGDMEEEDEDMYLKQDEEADANDGQHRLTRDLGSVSPAAAIFLTSILEFIGEHALLVAGEAAYNRVQMKHSIYERQRAVVEEVDMEKLAFNTTLGRLWRSWKKRVRSSSFTSPRPLSRDSQRYPVNSLSAGDLASGDCSISEEPQPSYFTSARGPSLGKTPYKGHASDQVLGEEAKGLPEEPDFSDFSTDVPSLEENRPTRGRPQSMVEMNGVLSKFSELSYGQSQGPGIAEHHDSAGRPIQRRQRSSSVPLRQTPFVSPVDESFITPSEGPDPLLSVNDRSKAEKDMPKLADSSSIDPNVDYDHSPVFPMNDGTTGQESEVHPASTAERNDRGISTYTDSSLSTEDYDREMTPQALNLSKSTPTTSSDPRQPQATTSSSDHSFQTEEEYPAEYSGRDEKSFEDIGAPVYSASVNQPDIKGQRQGKENLQDFGNPKSHEIDTDNGGGEPSKRDTPISSEALPSKETFDDSEVNTYSSDDPQDEDQIVPSTRPNRQFSGSPQGVPALSPLRESMDTTIDNSDEASSNTPSHDATKSDGFVPTHHYRKSGSASVSSSFRSQAQRPTSGSKLVDLRSLPLAVNTGAEKAAVQRVSPVTPLSATGRNSTSSNRPVTASSHTSHMSSKIKGIMGRESGDLVRQSMQKRESSEGTGSLARTPNKEQDFEELIKSDETVKYTLTPQNMREMEKTDSPRYSRPEVAEDADLVQDSPPASLDADQLGTYRSSLSKGLNGLRSNPTNSTAPILRSQPTTSLLETAKSRSKPIPKSPDLHAPGTFIRDPLMRDGSSRDFADFIRSTGPAPPPKPLPKPAASTSTKVSRPSSSSSSAGKAPKKITKQSPLTNAKKSDTPPQKKVTPKLEAREPTVGNNNETADLADFLRSGPPGAQVNGVSTSPWRGIGAQRPASSKGISNGVAREPVNSGSSVASTQDSFAASKMTQSSTNSRTGLLDSPKRIPPTSAPATKSYHQSQPRNDDPPDHARKQRRVRDPYAIDSDSDPEDGNDTPQPAPERQEESLSDFLRNYAPPPEATITRKNPPIISGAPKPTKQSAPSMRERLTRNIAVIPDYRPLPPKTPKKTSSSKSPPDSTTESRNSARSAQLLQRQLSREGYAPPNQNNVVRGRSTNNAPQLPPIDRRATSPHLTPSKQNGYNTESSRPIQSTYTKQADRMPKKPLQAREERGALGGPAQNQGMSDLADFLRETEPPAPSGPMPGAGPITPVREKEESAFGRMFGRRKKDVK